jgi:hypothetical protein
MMLSRDIKYDHGASWCGACRELLGVVASSAGQSHLHSLIPSLESLFPTIFSVDISGTRSESQCECHGRSPAAWESRTC